MFHGHLPPDVYFVPSGLPAALITLRTYLTVFLPTLLALTGVVLARRRGDVRYFAYGSLATVGVLALTWLVMTNFRR